MLCLGQERGVSAGSWPVQYSEQLGLGRGSKNQGVFKLYVAHGAFVGFQGALKKGWLKVPDSGRCSRLRFQSQSTSECRLHLHACGSMVTTCTRTPFLLFFIKGPSIR